MTSDAPGHAADAAHGGPPNDRYSDSVTLSRDEMQQVLERGVATHLSTYVTDYVLYQEHWWIAEHTSWLRIDDPELHGTLDRYQRRMAAGLFTSE